MLPSVQTARAWVDGGASVCLVSDCRYLYYSGMVPEYLGGVYPREAVRIDLEALCVRAGIPFVEAAAVRLDPAEQVVVTADGERHGYDLAAFDLGARNPGEPGAAIPTKPLYRLERLAALLDEALAASTAVCRLVIVGGGAAGVEVALNVMARFAAARRAQALRLHLVEQSERLLSGFPVGLARHAAAQLEARGATLHLETSVEHVTDAAVQLSGRPPLPADAVLWATGATGPALFRDAGLPCDERGLLRVNASLQSTAAPRLFAAGDCASVEGYETLPRIGVHAVKQGPLLRDNLARALEALGRGDVPTKDQLEDFTPYPVAPLILSTGTSKGWLATDRLWLRGTPMLRLKHFVDRRWMKKYADAWREAGILEMTSAETPQHPFTDR